MASSYASRSRNNVTPYVKLLIITSPIKYYVFEISKAKMPEVSISQHE